MLYDEFTLTARERGYCTPGKKLQPRFAYDAAERSPMREVRKARAIENKAMHEMYGDNHEIDAHWRKYHKAMDALSTRRRKFVETALEGEWGSQTMPGRAMRRAYLAAIECDQIERCIDADQLMWRNAI